LEVIPQGLTGGPIKGERKEIGIGTLLLQSGKTRATDGGSHTAQERNSKDANKPQRNSLNRYEESEIIKNGYGRIRGNKETIMLITNNVVTKQKEEKKTKLSKQNEKERTYNCDGAQKKSARSSPG